MQTITQRTNEILSIIKLRVDETKRIGGVTTRTALKIAKKAMPEIFTELETIIAKDMNTIPD